MSAIPVNLPDDLRAKAEARAAAAGRADVADYIRALVEEDIAGEVFDGPPHLSPKTPAEADVLIREGLESPTRPMTAADWVEIRRRVEDGITRGGTGLNRVERTDRSVTDIIDHALFIARRQPDAARRFVTAAEEAIRKLASMPGMGAVRESPDPKLAGLRQWPIKGFRNFLVIYRPLRDGIVVVRVMHGSQDIDRAIGE